VLRVTDRIRGLILDFRNRCEHVERMRYPHYVSELFLSYGSRSGRMFVAYKNRLTTRDFNYAGMGRWVWGLNLTMVST
jgi:hypothetical protein